MQPRSLIRALRSVAAPVGASCAALVLLTAYTSTGAAGDAPPRITVGSARVVAVPAGSGSTAAYFEIRNTGPSKDTLLYADSTELGISVLRRTVRRTGTGRTDPVWAVEVPAGGTVRMAPGGLGVVILDPPELRAGQTLPYTLWFRESGRVVVRATVTEG
ncbi:copper chaperone PCu(A)C [Streptomyces sp. CWNU-52B]|uniref:copper chaperone PCu(A)C n=1 Tax=unclassified Streptomyces TaxID=2593676 RepID=UPI0039BEF674